MRNSRCEEQKYPRKDTDPSTPHLINPRVKKKSEQLYDYSNKKKSLKHSTCWYVLGTNLLNRLFSMYI